MMKFILISLLAFFQCAATLPPLPDFKSSMLLKKTDGETDEHYLNNLKLYDSLDREYVRLFENIYQKNAAFMEQEAKTSYRIPRIIHQIWLGSKLPERYRHWMESWANLRGWKYKLWTDEDVAKLFMYNRDLYEKVENYGEKSDILRLEILNQFGGVYADIDYICLNKELFEKFHQEFDFYIGFEPLDHGIINKFRLFKVCNAIFASCPHHPLMEDLIQNLKANYYAYVNAYVIQRTGPSYLSRIICQYEIRGAHKQRNMYFPTSVFYPASFRNSDLYKTNPEEILKIFPEAAGIHYWEGSWHQSTTNPSDASTTVEKTGESPR